MSELISEKCCELFEETTGIEAPDSPDAMPGNALHRLGKARRKTASSERGPRRRLRLKLVFTKL